MPLNNIKPNSNMYQFLNRTWNPLLGECPNKCTYCYVSSMKKRFPTLNERYSGELRLSEKEMKTNLGKGNFIFVCSCNDLFADDVNRLDVIKILHHCNKYPDNKYFFQTKNPNRLLSFVSSNKYLPKNSSFCITLESNKQYSQMGLAPHPYDRVLPFEYIRGYDKYITIEPIMDFDLEYFVKMIKNCEPIQVNLGFDSGNNNLCEPPKEKVLELISELEKFTIIHKKNNFR